ncbi:undecaprenyl-phosphate glucose phosphotransferase [Rhodocyclus tenuis]|uniref:Undecaprenyl-phosphate glucose phosphotransferase n=1 Tax=Rhodocyclus gracilis TaxID=2929842 RepID=A0ABX0WJE3_9RHOO|nr:undecaprenyl-phosphate glucose phosphotransferase [Rhodocyclus gracilis]MRD73884.1 undecaprenyl-phosphate glucose phosphotransferase [Rhodocyclus gracilis]NJA89846.1 undecaprenyl-phosphate glucose phosphotransferase [Rhodocyclus gracilis]
MIAPEPATITGIAHTGVATPLGRDHLLTAIEVVLEPALLVVSLWALALADAGDIAPAYLILAVITFSLSFPGHSRLGVPFWKALGDILLGWLWICALLLFLGVATRYLQEFSTSVLASWFVVAPSVLIAAHLALRAAAPSLARLQGRPQAAIIVGMNDPGVALAQRVCDTPLARIHLEGFFDDRAPPRLERNGHGPLLGPLSALSAYVKQQHIRLIYLSLPMASQPRILQVLDELKDTTASIYFVPDMFVTDLIQGRPGAVCGIPVIAVCETPFTGSNGLIKRGSDIVLSLLILALIAPLMLAVSIAVKLSSPGPVIFRQRRYGLDGEEIVVYKFRSMTVCEDGPTIVQASARDVRVTPLGHFLRKSSLDELPQFINVLQGRMSIVGPRPHAVAHNELYRRLIKGYMVRHKVKPGITGWAQVNGYRGETDTLDKMQARIDHDLDYLRNWSLGLDIHIIFKTIRVVLQGNAAH